MTSITPTIERRYLHSGAAAVYLGVTVNALYALVERRQIPFRRQGRKLVFDAMELDAYMHGLEGVDVAEAVARRLNNGTLREIST